MTIAALIVSVLAMVVALAAFRKASQANLRLDILEEGEDGDA